jgi:muramoyltetrapeptide carboxypeptidase LdcA involved in peptidoglycan recycling
MPGATIGVISPSKPSETRSEVPRAVEYLSAMGYNIITGRNLNIKRRGLLLLGGRQSGRSE